MTVKEKQLFRKVFAKAYSTPSRYVVPTATTRSGGFTGPYRKTTVSEYLVYMHWMSSYYFQTQNLSMCTETPKKNKMDFAHNDFSLLFFHRLVTLIWEKEFRRISREYFHNGNWSMPYWDWTDAKRCEVCTDDFVGSETGAYDVTAGGYRLSPKSDFHNFEEICSSKTNLLVLRLRNKNVSPNFGRT